ncbi:hypothetical protein [Pinisolibacter sp.]|uniref:hypothetical protein n=1 Tax=Pinisolibacter sp. TaxID=2172024 RepID=UPI002FDDE702
MTVPLEHVVLIYESRARWVTRKIDDGWSRDDAQIASYWLFAEDDVLLLSDLLRFSTPSFCIHIYEIEQIDELIDWIKGIDRSKLLIWNVSDGLRQFRGSLIPALARLLKVSYFGSPIAAQALAQDRFKLSAVASEAGILVPRCFLARGAKIVSAPHTIFDGSRYFVKTNSFGNMVGLNANRAVLDIRSALIAAEEIDCRFHDESLIQEYLPGIEIRASYIAGTADDSFSLCLVDFFDKEGGVIPHYEIAPSGYIGDDYFRPIEEVDVLDHLEVERLYREVGRSVNVLKRILGLKDYWAMDFRLDAGGIPKLIDLNTGAFPKGDAFRHHARLRHSADFGDALAACLKFSHAQSAEHPPEE